MVRVTARVRVRVMVRVLVGVRVKVRVRVRVRVRSQLGAQRAAQLGEVAQHAAVEHRAAAVQRPRAVGGLHEGQAGGEPRLDGAYLGAQAAQRVLGRASAAGAPRVRVGVRVRVRVRVQVAALSNPSSSG